MKTMNWLVGIAVVAMAAAGFALRSPESIPVRTRVKPEQSIPAVIATAVPREVPQHVERASQTVLRPAQAPVVELDPKSEREESSLDRERTLLQLEAGLGLSPEQRRHFEVVLLEREGAIEAFHAEIRASKVLWTWGYDKRIREILASSQARMTAVLSPEQTRRFYGLYEQGTVTEGVSFEITPELTILR